MCVNGISDSISEERARQMLEHVLEVERQRTARRAHKLLRKATIAALKGNTERCDQMLQLAQAAATDLPEHLRCIIAEAVEEFQVSGLDGGHANTGMPRLQIAV